MIIWGVSIPSFAVALTGIIGAAVIGLGMGIGSEIGKYYVQKWIAHKEKIKVEHIVNKVVKLVEDDLDGKTFKRKKDKEE